MNLSRGWSETMTLPRLSDKNKSPPVQTRGTRNKHMSLPPILQNRESQELSNRRNQWCTLLICSETKRSKVCGLARFLDLHKTHIKLNSRHKFQAKKTFCFCFVLKDLPLILSFIVLKSTSASTNSVV